MNEDQRSAHLPTAEEILKQEVLKVTNGMDYEHNVTHVGIIKAMEEYKDLHTAPLREELDKLRADKESLLVRVEEVREINKQLEHEMLVVKRNNKDLEAENETLKSDKSRLEGIISANEQLLNDRLKENERLRKDMTDVLSRQFEIAYENSLLHSQTQKLREALVKIANSDSSGPDTDGLIEIAKEALKGGSDE